MIKVILAVVGTVLLFGTSYYVSTEIGLRTEGWHEVVVEVPGNPDYAAVGQTYAMPDGSKVLVTAVTRGERGKHRMHANVHGTHRHALALFPARWEHAFAMDTASLEWTLRQAGGMAPGPMDRPAGRQWHVLN